MENKMSKNSYTQRKQNHTAWRKKSSNCLHTPARFHLLAFKEAQLLGSWQLWRRKEMLPKCLMAAADKDGRSTNKAQLQIEQQT